MSSSIDGKRELEQAFATTARLLNVCDSRFPYQVATTNLTPNGDAELDNWDLVAPAFVFTGASCLYSIHALGQCNLPRDGTQDAVVLLRRLYEYAVTFAWIATDHVSNVKAWLASDFVNRLKANRELRELGHSGLSQAVEVKYRNYLAAHPQRMMDVKGRTILADRYWADRIPLHGRKTSHPTPRLSFETLYTSVYRGASADAHATAGALTPWINGTGNGSFSIGATDEHDYFPYTFAPIVFGSWLFIIGHVLGWPSEAEVVDAFAGWRTA